MKHFTDSDLRPHAGHHGINISDTDDLLLDPLDWQKRGLQQTASGYGRKLTSQWKISFNGRMYRLYCTCFGNAGSTWFKAKGKLIYVN